MKRFMKSRFGIWLLSWLVTFYTNLIWITGRWTVIGREHIDHFQKDGKPWVLAFWHGRIVMLPYVVKSRKYPVHVLASKHGDAEIAVRWAERLGFLFMRGSSSEGSREALRTMRRIAKEGGAIGITPDGPRGPRMHAKAGVVVASQAGNMPVVCVSFAAKSNKTFSRAWDRHHLPLPFTKGVIIIGEPVAPPISREPEAMEIARKAVEDKLNDVTRQADEWCGLDPILPATPEEGEKLKRKEKARREREQQAAQQAGSGS